ncbi:MAG: efflux RND transporter periplasmic adaptor subunit [Polaromonas sp.]|uniref:efflux RND transporter periplasmic adaptor subunit n=1 Tax=Polaromonas sp. TaxID=1869339 RepID=UPI0027305F7A|nr:efflux RND transporter periplasmic adaptor subunit [Polaromonas sp.]MDP3245868.1 efflux RND transporter periplasmic adaptor subunit [Polaromonas sp.]MDP3754999.1 efflux RND transporter periplasmic adaptor subunit [Polaromonas sp.]
MKKLQFPVFQALALVLGLALSAGSARAVTAVEVPVVQIRAKAVPTGFELDGVVQPVQQSTLSAQASGRVASLLVKAGDRVRAGQLLATIDDRETQTGVQRSQAQVAQAEAELRNARANAERSRELQAMGFVSKAALDTANTQLNAAQAGRDQAAAGSRQSALAQGFTRVTAPYDGWVLQTLSEAGDLAMPGTPLLTLYAPLPLRAVVQVPASLGDIARSASQVEIQGPAGKAGPQWLVPVARSVLPSADPVSQTIEWRLELPTAGTGGLVPGQQVRVRFVGGASERMVLPASAVVRRGELTAVYVVAGQGFSLRAVRLGSDHGTAGVEVLAGLSAGDSVALDPVRAGLSGARPQTAAR